MVNLKDKLKDNNVKKVVIIGLGFIGLEVVEMVVKYNKIVLLVEKVFMLVFKVFDNEISELLE